MTVENANDNKPELNFEPPEEIPARSLPATIALRFGAVILGAFIGFSLYIVSYMNVIFIIDGSPGYGDYIVGRFTLSVLIWSILGLCTPFSKIKSFLVFIFDSLNITSFSNGLAAFGRIALICIIFFIFLILYWYFIDFTASIINSIFV